MEQSKADNGSNRLTIALFIIYLIVLNWILLFKLGVRFSYMAERRTNFVVFREPVILSSENILNVMIFVPLGIYVEILFEKWFFGKKLFSVFLLSLLIEGLQYVLRIGAFDITDIVTNTVGGIVGIMICKGVEKALGNHHGKAQGLINKIAATGTALVILLLVLLKLNMLPIRYQ